MAYAILETYKWQCILKETISFIKLKDHLILLE